MEDAKLTRKDKLEFWQLCRITIDYKNKVIGRDEALRQFGAYTGLPPALSKMMLDPMSKETIPHLRKAFPDWITKDMVPALKDTTRGTRKDPYAKAHKPRGRPPTKRSRP